MAAITLYSTALKRLKNECANTVGSLTEVGNSMIGLFVCDVPWLSAIQWEELEILSFFGLPSEEISKNHSIYIHKIITGRAEKEAFSC